MRIGGVIVVIWLVVGVIASYQRGYFPQAELNCAA
jgi:hypothetical protein